MQLKSLSKNKRYFYLFICVIAFLIFSPMVAMYATGYRFSDKYGVMKTGGMYVVTEGKDFNVFINNIPQKSSSLFRRNFLVQDMKPGIYEVKVTKDGFMTWIKKMNVYPEKVNEIYPFNLPEIIDIVEIPKTILTPVVENGTTTSSKKEINNKEFIYVKNLFLNIASYQLENSTSTISRKKITVENVGNEIFVKWFGDENSTPIYFCDLDKCLTKMSIYQGEKVNRSELFSDRNDLIIFSTVNGIYVTEADGRGGRNIQPVVFGTYDFRIDDNGIIFLKKGKSSFYRVDLIN